ncbi:hypothetical protein SG34_024605 [Thalassomonas viridans]|uniref:Tse2 ADP-ribosyltransferase toxin domain-containing protein n=1 Tax=Thalassomonas viridans TaxID=137584 RepID=A0AAE9Z0P5_9GAMM|nr:hypothetical protein [Thalassomonas viridans]WDE04480.1 hypothetical protein SG34_024605 [Thalassomonas viridans]
MEDVELLKDILLEAGSIDRFFDGHVPVDLYRAKKVKSDKPLFDLVETEVVRKRGAPRKADITIKNARVYVRHRPRGISTFDRPNTFRGHWEYYKLPAGTVLPKGLVIVKDSYNPVFEATHYTIAPERDMPLFHFKMLLNELAGLVEKEEAI